MITSRRTSAAVLAGAATLLVAACAHSGAGAAASASPGRAACEQAMVQQLWTAAHQPLSSWETHPPAGHPRACDGLDESTLNTLATQAFATFLRQESASPLPLPSFTDGLPPDSGFSPGGTVRVDPSPSGS